jgi:hypothetical protein
MRNSGKNRPPSWAGGEQARKASRLSGSGHDPATTWCALRPSLATDSLLCRGRWEETNMALRKFIIERDIPKVGSLERDQLRDAAAKSNEALTKLSPDIQWQESFVAADKTFCVYLAKDEAVIRKHAEISGFPATKITEIRKIIDPTTAAS